MLSGSGTEIEIADRFEAAIEQRDPFQALQALQQFLCLLVVQNKLAARPFSVSQALEITEFILKSWKEVYVCYARILSEDPTQVETLARAIGFSKEWLPDISEDVANFIINLPNQMLFALNTLLSNMTTEATPIIEAYVELSRLIADNNNTLLRKLKLFIAENNLMNTLINHLLWPNLDPDEKRLSEYFTYERAGGGIKWYCILEGKTNPALGNLDKASRLLWVMKSKNYPEVKGSDSDWISDFSECEMAIQALSIVRGYMKKYRVAAESNKPKNMESVSGGVSKFKAILTASDAAGGILTKLQVLSTDAEKLICAQRAEKAALAAKEKVRAKRQHQRSRRQPKRVVMQAEETAIAPTLSVADIIPLSTLSLEPTIPDVLPSSLNSSAGSGNGSCTVPCSSSSSSSSFNIEESPVYTPDYKAYPRKSKHAKPSSQVEQDEVYCPVATLSSKAQKTLSNIFDDSKKIKYTSLVNFIKYALKGYVKSDTGSSSRKFQILDQTLCMHQRHGRDRKQFVDVAVVKAIHNMLTVLNITPDIYNQQVKKSAIRP